MKHYLNSFILVLLIVGGINFYIDVENKYWRQNDFFPRIPEDKVLLVPGNRNEREDKIKFLKSTSVGNYLILGSSRSIRWGQEETKLNQTITNLSVSTASMEEVAAFYEASLQQSALPKVLILSLDPWMVNENSQGSDADWLERSGYFQDFNVRVFGNSANSLQKKMSIKLKTLVENFKSLLSAERFFASLKYVSKFGWNPKNQYQLQNRQDKDETLYAIKSDGALLYPKKYLEQTQIEIDEQAQHYPDKSTDYLFRNFEISEEKLKILTALIQDAKSKNMQVILISPPFHPISFHRLSNMDMYKEALNHWQKLLIGFSNQTKVCDFTNPQILACDNSAFSDGMHMKESCIASIFSKCLP